MAWMKCHHRISTVGWSSHTHRMTLSIILNCMSYPLSALQWCIPFVEGLYFPPAPHSLIPFLVSTVVAWKANQREVAACPGPSPLASWGMMEPQAAHGLLGADGDCEMLSLLLPSPQSEAVTHEMEELSLQPTQNLPPLNERKNGERFLLHSPVGTCSWYTNWHRLL